MSWRYGSENIRGNAHDAVQFINKHHPDWDVISMSFDGENGTPGSVTLVVYRVEKPLADEPGLTTNFDTDRINWLEHAPVTRLANVRECCDFKEVGVREAIDFCRSKP